MGENIVTFLWREKQVPRTRYKTSIISCSMIITGISSSLSSVFQPSLSIPDSAAMISHATLQVSTLAQTTFLLGINTALSTISIPSVVISPSPVLAIRQWHTHSSASPRPPPLLSALRTSFCPSFSPMPQLSATLAAKQSYFMLPAVS